MRVSLQLRGLNEPIDTDVEIDTARTWLSLSGRHVQVGDDLVLITSARPVMNPLTYELEKVMVNLLRSC